MYLFKLRTKAASCLDYFWDKLLYQRKLHIAYHIVAWSRKYVSVSRTINNSCKSFSKHGLNQSCQFGSYEQLLVKLGTKDKASRLRRCTETVIWITALISFEPRGINRQNTSWFLVNWPHGTYFNQILFEIHDFKKVHMQISSSKIFIAQCVKHRIPK